MIPLAKKIASKEVTVGVVGMGYIGLSFLDAFAKAGFRLVGFDVDTNKVEMLKRKESYLNYMTLTELFNLIDQNKFEPSSNPSILSHADVIVISVTTSLDPHHTPDLPNLRKAFQSVADNLKKDQLIILQSSTYPGTTQKELLPLLEKSGLKAGKDFYIAYVPEIFDIGNTDFAFLDVPRIMGGTTPSCLEVATTLYETIGCKVVPCSSPGVAEAAKLLQNVYRMINISLVNEMKMMFDHMGLDIWEVIAAASTKPFGYAPFYPSAGAGGDCIPVCNAYMIWEAKETDAPTTLMEVAEHVNEQIPQYVVDKLIQGLATRDKSIKNAKILVLGITYKKDVNDIRYSPALKVLSILKHLHADVVYYDPYIPEIPLVAKYPTIHKMQSIQFNDDRLSHYAGPSDKKDLTFSHE